MNAPQIILIIAFAYVAIGLVFALAFVCRGITSVDAAAKGSSAAFRLLIVPGASALWPLMLRKWHAARRGEVNHDPH